MIVGFVDFFYIIFELSFIADIFMICSRGICNGLDSFLSMFELIFCQIDIGMHLSFLLLEIQ